MLKARQDAKRPLRALEVYYNVIPVKECASLHTDFRGLHFRHIRHHQERVEIVEGCCLYDFPCRVEAG